MSINSFVNALGLPAFAPGPVVAAPVAQSLTFDPCHWAQKEIPVAPALSLPEPALVSRQSASNCVGPNTPASCPASDAWCAFAKCASTQILVGNGDCPDAYVVAACADKYSCDASTGILNDDGQGFTCQQDFKNLQSCCTGNNGGNSGSNSGAYIGVSFNPKFLVTAMLLTAAAFTV